MKRLTDKMTFDEMYVKLQDIVRNEKRQDVINKAMWYTILQRESKLNEVESI